jgi:mRNA-degrading endonuclease YafQ of YafQ-DinJ toxin-antitoxin module
MLITLQTSLHRRSEMNTKWLQITQCIKKFINGLSYVQRITNTHTHTALVTVHKYIREGHISSDMSIAYVIWQSIFLLQFAMSNISLLRVVLISQTTVLYTLFNHSFIHSFVYLYIYFVVMVYTHSPPKVTHCRTVGRLTSKELQRMWQDVLKAESEVLSQTAACRDWDEAWKTYIRTATLWAHIRT